MTKTKLITENPELLLYLDGKLHISILGGIKLTGLDRLKVTLKVVSTEDKQNAFRHSLDLYNSIQTEQLIEKSAEALDISTNEISTAISQLTTALENYRAERLESMKPKQPEKKQLTDQERKAAIQYLKSPDLLQRTKQALAESGIIGEETNALIAYLTYTSRKRHTPLHLMCLGASGTGKTWLQEKVSELMPEEDKLEITTLSMNAFYYFGTSSAPLFAMQLYYNTASSTKTYNGNIAYQFWGTPGNLSHSYSYAYDKLNRLRAGSSNDNFNETGIAYDLEGNITQLNRYSAGTLIDQLSYTYTSGSNPTNQLQSINDATTSDLGLKHGTSNFTYDGNGNLITDPTKGTGITIAYNMLNLPQTVTGGKTITYTYDATGQKLRRVSPVTGNTDYIGGIQYDGTTTPALSFIQTEEGKAVPNLTGGYEYEYYLGDNLGNTRVTFGTKTGTAVSYQQDDYYPFGMEISNSVLSPKNEYLYNKKELQEELQEYDYGARFYDPVIGRMSGIDPHAEVYRKWTPYNYCADNPIRFIDPDGMDFDETNDKKAHQIQKDIATKKSSNNTTIAQLNGKIDANKTKVLKLAAGLALGGGDSKSVKELKSAANDITSDTKKADNLQTENTYLRQSNDDIEALRNDHGHDYSFESPSGNDGYNYVTGADNSRAVGIVGSDDGFYVHEMRHIGQNLSAGGLKFRDGNGRLLNAGTNLAKQVQNEMEGYRCGYAFSHYSPVSVSDINGINDNVWNLNDSDGTPVYNK